MSRHTRTDSGSDFASTKYSVHILGGVFVLFCLTLLGLIVWASVEKSVADILRMLFAERWGIVTLLDLYGGFLVTSIWIAVLERRTRRVIPWIIGILLLGNLVTALYVLWRLRSATSITHAFTQLVPSVSHEQRSS